MELDMSNPNEKPLVNGSEAFDYMHAASDQVVKNILSLFYVALIRAEAEGLLPAAPFDLLYCFKVLELACSNKPELWIAARGDVPSPEPPDWI
jgi:hypothetical protein